MLVSATLTVFLVLLLAFRWRFFIHQQEIGISFRSVLCLTWAGQFFNTTLPGSTGGDILKIYHLCKFNPERKAAAAATVVADRIIALLALSIIAGAAFLINPEPLRLVLKTHFPVIAILIVAVALLGGISLLIWVIFRASPGRELLRRIGRTLRAARGALSWNFNLLAAVLLAFVIHCLSFLSVFCLARALGVAITYPQVLLMMAVVLLVIMVPLTINGHGLRELLFIGYFTQMGITQNAITHVAIQESAVALSLLMVTNDLFWMLPGGVWYMLTFRTQSTNASIPEIIV